ncbi:hypothetical protein HYV30_03545 [Candidatus Kaiserbacteria bacterium]|nr:hypothetical protein [Candidatus Kaiserbacteria bacterium]
MKRLRELDSQIRKFYARRSPGELPVNRCLRALTEAEWREIVALIEEHEFPCFVMHAPYGFIFSVHEVGAVQGAVTPFLLAVEDSQFPFSSARRGFEGQAATLHALEPLIYGRRNVEILRWHGFDELQPDITSYTY